MSDTFDLILAGYPATEPAQKDFDELVKLVKAKKVRSDGVILVVRDEAGEVHVTDTGDHLGRKGAGWGGGVGVLVGLAAPPMLGAVAVGAAAGGLVGRFAKHKVDSGLEIGHGRQAQAGHRRHHRHGRRRGSPRRRTRAERRRASRSSPWTRRASGASRTRFQRRRASSTPTAPYCRSPTAAFGGTAGRTIDQSVGDWSMIPGPSAPEGAPNVLLVLIDDAGFGGPDTFGGGIATPNLTRVQKMGVTYNRFHVTAVCSPTRAAHAHRTQPPPGRHGRDRRAPGAVSRLHRDAPAQLHPPAPHTQGERLHHRRLRQMAPHAGPRDGRRRIVRPLAAGLGLRPLVGLPDRGRRPVRPHHHPGQLHARRARGQRRQALLLPRRHHRQGRRVAARGPRTGRPEALVPLLLHRL